MKLIEVLCICLFSSMVVIMGASEAAVKAPRLRLQSEQAVKDFVKQHAQDERTVLLVFFKEDEEEAGKIAHRDKDDGLYQKFLKIDRNNANVILGMIVSNELSQAFGVMEGKHFIQVSPTKDEGKYEFRHARFFSSNILAPDNAGAVIAFLQNNNIIPFSDRNDAVPVSSDEL